MGSEGALASVRVAVAVPASVAGIAFLKKVRQNADAVASCVIYKSREGVSGQGASGKKDDFTSGVQRPERRCDGPLLLSCSAEQRPSPARHSGERRSALECLEIAKGTTSTTSSEPGNGQTEAAAPRAKRATLTSGPDGQKRRIRGRLGQRGRTRDEAGEPAGRDERGRAAADVQGGAELQH